MTHETASPDELCSVITDELGLTCDGYDVNQRTVIVERDDDVASHSGVEALAERNGYFVFATDADEFTLVAREDCEWKSTETGVVEVPGDGSMKQEYVRRDP